MGAGVCRPLPRPLHENFRLWRDGPAFYATGLSAGGAITLRLGLRHAELFGVIAALAAGTIRRQRPRRSPSPRRRRCRRARSPPGCRPRRRRGCRSSCATTRMPAMPRVVVLPMSERIEFVAAEATFLLTQTGLGTPAAEG